MGGGALPVEGRRVCSVSELTAAIQRVIEGSFPAVLVRGEVSRLTRHASGHLYFTVKDAKAALSAVLWRSTAARLRRLPEEGGEYIFQGHLSVYPPRGGYQLVVRALRPAGEGALALEFVRRKEEWAARGWFDAARKRPLPPLPRHIGVVTSPTAAAWQDVRKVLAVRPAWLRITLAPAVVQGAEAPESIARALRGLAAVAPDVILLVRGGGSMEDLWCFNDERVVRAILDAPAPVITGIGHEIDLTLADLAADLRAATPSNAAERCCPDRAALAARVAGPERLRQLAFGAVASARERLAGVERRLLRTVPRERDRWCHAQARATQGVIAAYARRLRRLRGVHDGLAGRLLRQDPRRQLRLRRQRLQLAQSRLQQVPVRLRRMRHHYRAAALRMRQQAPRLVVRHGRLRDLQTALHRQAMRRVHACRQRWLAADRTLRALDPHRVLERGYVMVRREEDGRLVTRAIEVGRGDALGLRFVDGSLSVVVR